MPLTALDGQAPLIRTRPISPSKLSLFAKCPLRYVYESERPSVTKLPTGPMALRGTAVHKVVQQFLGSGTATGVAIKDAMYEEIARLVGKVDAAPVVKWVYEKHGLLGLMSREHAIEACQFALTEVIDHSIHRESLPTEATKEYSGPASHLGSEKWFDSAELDLAGKLDLTYFALNGALHVIDFKTGQVLDQAGGPKDEFLIQVGAYGLMAKQILCAREVNLELIGPRGKWAGVLDDALEKRVEALVCQLRLVIPKNVPLDPRQLAVAGQHCRDCTFRPSCPEYRDRLREESELDQSEVVSPADVVGILQSIDSTSELANIRVLASRSRIVSIAGLPMSLYADSLAVGRQVTAYSVGILEVRGRSQWPANYCVVRCNDLKASAFNSLLLLH